MHLRNWRFIWGIIYYQFGWTRQKDAVTHAKALFSRIDSIPMQSAGRRPQEESLWKWAFLKLDVWMEKLPNITGVHGNGDSWFRSNLNRHNGNPETCAVPGLASWFTYLTHIKPLMRIWFSLNQQSWSNTFHANLTLPNLNFSQCSGTTANASYPSKPSWNTHQSAPLRHFRLITFENNLSHEFLALTYVSTPASKLHNIHIRKFSNLAFIPRQKKSSTTQTVSECQSH